MVTSGVGIKNMLGWAGVEGQSRPPPVSEPNFRMAILIPAPRTRPSKRGTRRRGAGGVRRAERSNPKPASPRRPGDSAVAADGALSGAAALRRHGVVLVAADARS